MIGSGHLAFCKMDVDGPPVLARFVPITMVRDLELNPGPGRQFFELDAVEGGLVKEELFTISSDEPEPALWR